MRTHSLLTCLLFALVVAGCDVGTVVDPGDSTAAAEVTGKTQEMVPIKGSATFAADLTVVPPVLFCDDVDVFFRRFTGEGIISHLGASTFVGVSDACWIEEDDLAVTGTSTFTAANGDELWAIWGIQGVAGAPNEGVVEWSFHAYAGDYPIEFTGGTGRFEGANGHAVGGGTMDYSTLTGTYWFEGIISSVGSLK